LNENLIQSFIASIKRYGFIVLPLTFGDKILELLRHKGAIHLIQVHRHNELMIIEINKAPCIRQCDMECRDVSAGSRSLECYNSCVDECLMSRLQLLLEKLREIA